MLAWMVWTTPVAVFFGCIVLMLVGMTVWEIRSPTTLRKGFLPIATTRGCAAAATSASNSTAALPPKRSKPGGRTGRWKRPDAATTASN